MGEESPIDRLIREAGGVIRTEDLVVESMRDLLKDEIKKYVRERLEANPELKKELKDAVGGLMEAKIKEAYAMLKLAKAGAKLGLELVPPHLRQEISKEVAAIIEKELSAVMDRA